MKRFELVGRLVFEAEDINDAFDEITRHFAARDEDAP